MKVAMARDVSWAKAISIYFAKVELCAHLEILRRTPALEFKKKAMDSVIKKLEALDK